MQYYMTLLTGRKDQGSELNLTQLDDLGLMHSYGKHQLHPNLPSL